MPALGFVLLWNSGFIAAEIALPHAPTFTLLLWRYAALAALLLLTLISWGSAVWPGQRPAGHAMCIGVLSHGVWLACVMLALDLDVPAGIVALVAALQPLLTGALSGKVTGERTPPGRWLGLGIGFAGVSLVLLARIDFQNATSVFGYLIPLGSVVGITVASLIQRHAELYRRELLLPAVQSMLYQSIGTVLAVFPLALALENLETNWNWELAGSLVWLVLAVSLGAYALMWKLIGRMDATRVASLFYFGPPVTMIMAWLAFRDTLRVTDLCGLVLVLVGVCITYGLIPIGRSK